MNTLKTLFAVAAVFGAASLGMAAPQSQHTRAVATYKPLAGFNHVVGDTRFVGYFVAGPGRCDVTLFTARAEDEALTTPARRTVLQIAAAGRSEIDAGADSAIAIACTADADAIKIAPQQGRLRSAGL